MAEQHKIDRVRPPRVQITYDVEVGGAIELKDQLTALDQLLPQVPQLDRSRMAMWGWSNGGSMTLYTLTHSDLFKAGVSVAPVSD